MEYQGSKRRYTKYIVPIIQETIAKSGCSCFIDACCGGCHVVEKIKCGNRIALDNNPYLIAFWDYVTHGGEIPEDIPSRETYNAVKSHKEDYEPWYVGLIEHLTTFNGRGFVGGYGVIHKTRGEQYSNRRANVMRQLPGLEGVTFLCKDVNELDVDDVVIYIDPPYNATAKYDSLVDSPFDYSRFWETVRRLAASNYVFVSEEHAPEDFDTVWSLEVKRNIKGVVSLKRENLYVWRYGMRLT